LLRLLDEKTRRYSVRCKNSEFELSAQCPDHQWDRCLRTIRTWRMLDTRLEAMRRLAEKRELGIDPDIPHCRGALAVPDVQGQAIFNLACENGFVRLEVVCPGEEVNDEKCKVFVREKMRLPYGHPPK
jgi:hypothetical protein